MNECRACPRTPPVNVNLLLDTTNAVSGPDCQAECSARPIAATRVESGPGAPVNEVRGMSLACPAQRRPRPDGVFHAPERARFRSLVSIARKPTRTPFFWPQPRLTRPGIYLIDVATGGTWRWPVAVSALTARSARRAAARASAHRSCVVCPPASERPSANREFAAGDHGRNASLRLDREGVRRHAGAQGRELRGPARRDRRAARRERRWQIDADQDPQRRPQGGFRRDHARRRPLSRGPR